MEPRAPPRLRPQPKSRPARRSRRIALAWLGSAGVHAWLLAQTLAAEPADRSSTPPPATIEFVVIEAEPGASAVGPSATTRALMAAGVESLADEPLPPTRETPRPKAPRARPKQTQTQAQTQTTSRPPAPLALNGLRPHRQSKGSSARGQGIAAPLEHEDLHGGLEDVELEPPRDPATSKRTLEGPAAPLDVDDPMAGVVPLADGSLGYTDPSGLFNAFIDPDGSVRFHDSKSLKVKACVAFVCVGGGQVKQLERGGKAHRSTVGVDFALVPLGIGGVFGRQVGLNRKESEFLRRTAQMRTAMTVKWQRRQIISALNQLRAQLDALWADTSLSDAERKRIYRELWDECDVGSDADEEVVWQSLPRKLHRARTEAAQRARKVIAEDWKRRTGEPLF